MTVKQKEVAEKIVENRGNIGKTMLAAGYSPNTAKNPKNLTTSKGWVELMQEYLPDSEIAKAHQGLLEAAHLRTEMFTNTIDDEVIKRIIESVEGRKVIKILPEGKQKHCYYSAPDRTYRKNAIEMAYKLKNRYPREEPESEMSAEMRESIDKISEFMRTVSQREGQ